MLLVGQNIQIPEQELEERFIRSPGPGGQHVNKSDTAVQLRFDAAHSPSLPEPVRRRLLSIAGHRLAASGELLIEAHRFRSRERNREDARERLAELISEAMRRPKPRLQTKPSRAAKRRRIQAKKQRGQKKAQRRPPSLD